MTYRVLFVASDPVRELVQCIAGCTSEMDAVRKLETLFKIRRIKKIELHRDPEAKLPTQVASR